MNKSKEVDQFIQDLNYGLKAEVEELRNIILGANELITEHIKWNAPSFCKNNEDRITMNLKSEKFVQIIFHRGAKINKSEFKFEDKSGLLTWLSPDRATVKFSSLEDIKANQNEFSEVVNKWIEAT